MIEVYLLNEEDDRDYFIDKTNSNVIGLCERFGITLAERPEIPTAQMRKETIAIPGRDGQYSRENGYENVQISLRFNYIDEGNARETYYAVSNYLKTLEPGTTRFRLSDDRDQMFRTLDERPMIRPLNNDLLQWGDFTIDFTFKPFRTFEWKEVTMEGYRPHTFYPPYPNAMDTPQKVIHQVEGEFISLMDNDDVVYFLKTAGTRGDEITVDGKLLYAYTNPGSEDVHEMFTSASEVIDNPYKEWDTAFILSIFQTQRERLEYSEVHEPEGIRTSEVDWSRLVYYIDWDNEGMSYDDEDSFISYVHNETGKVYRRPLHLEIDKVKFEHLNIETEKAEELELRIAFFVSGSHRFFTVNTPRVEGVEFTVVATTESGLLTVEEEYQKTSYSTSYKDDEILHLAVYKDGRVIYEKMFIAPKIDKVIHLGKSKDMTGSFPTLNNDKKTLESNVTTRFRPTWNYL